MAHLLIVEDQPEIRRLIRMTLELESYQVHEAADGSEGWAMAQALLPDLILLDVMMPGDLDGLQLCARLRADPKLKHTPVLLLSARGQQQDRERGLQAGANAYLIKPFSPMQLLDTIERWLPPEAAQGPSAQP